MIVRRRAMLVFRVLQCTPRFLHDRIVQSRNSNWVWCLFFCISKVALLGKIATKIRSFSGLNFITNFTIESYEEKISATYRLSDEEPCLRRRTMFVFRVLQCTRFSRPRPAFSNECFEINGLKNKGYLHRRAAYAEAETMHTIC